MLGKETDLSLTPHVTCNVTEIWPVTIKYMAFTSADEGEHFVNNSNDYKCSDFVCSTS